MRIIFASQNETQTEIRDKSTPPSVMDIWQVALSSSNEILGDASRGNRWFPDPAGLDVVPLLVGPTHRECLSGQGAFAHDHAQ